MLKVLLDKLKSGDAFVLTIRSAYDRIWRVALCSVDHLGLVTDDSGVTRLFPWTGIQSIEIEDI